MFMDPYFFEDLSAEDQAAINAISGAELSVLAGKAWDESDTSGIEIAQEAGVNVKKLTADDMLSKAFDERLKSVPQHWIDSVDAKGYNGQEALDHLRKLAQEYSESHGA